MEHISSADRVLDYHVKNGDGMNNEVQLNVKEILRFFDEKKSENKGHVSSVIALVGEDLGAGLFQHYLREQEHYHNVEILRDPNGHTVGCSTGKKTGPRLDCWIYVEDKKGKQFLFQTEIKSWSAYAVGGNKLEVDASDKVIKEFAIDRWERYKKEFFKPQAIKDEKKRKKKEENAKKVLKVLKEMKPPDIEEYKDLKPVPLLILWVVIHPKGKKESYFLHSFDKLPKLLWGKPIAKKIHFFSVSMYLRSLRDKGKKTIKIEMPSFASRVKWINNLFLFKDVRRGDKQLLQNKNKN